MTWDIRYFYIDIAAAGLTWNGSSMTVPAGTYAIAGEVGGAEFGGLFLNRGAWRVVYGSSTLTGPSGTAETIVGADATHSMNFLVGGSPQGDIGITALLLSDGSLVFVQLYPDDSLSGIIPESVTLSVAASVTKPSFSFTSDFYTGSFGGAAGLTCFAAGTLIATLRGPVAVEAIRPGDRVLTRDRGFRPLRWAGRQAVSAARLAAAERLRPVRIAAGALGPGVPARDLLVSPQHRMLLAGPEIAARFGTPEVLVAAKHLVGRPGITVEVPAGGIAYHHLLFDAHEVVLADGAWAESLFTGPMAMKLMPAAQRAEILTLFPALAQGGPPHAAPARRFLSGAEARGIVRCTAPPGPSARSAPMASLGCT